MLGLPPLPAKSVHSVSLIPALLCRWPLGGGHIPGLASSTLTAEGVRAPSHRAVVVRGVAQTCSFGHCAPGIVSTKTAADGTAEDPLAFLLRAPP